MRRNMYLLWFCVIALFGATVADGTTGDISDVGSGNIPDVGDGDILDVGDDGTANVSDDDENPDAPATAPTSPNTTAPTSPSTAAPTSPSTSSPTNSSTSSPTNSSTSSPTSPSISSPTSPSTSSPTNSSTSEPTNPSTSEPTNPSTSEPTNPSTSSPTSPSTSSPTSPSTSSPTSPSTSSPTSPSTSSPTSPSTSAPTQSPIEKNFDFVIRDETGKPCIASKMTITLNINYKTKQGSSTTKQLKVPEDAIVEGTCKGDVAVMILTWSQAMTLATATDNNVVVTFLEKNSILSVDRINASIYLDNKNFPDAQDQTVQVVSGTDLGLFSASSSNSIHRCDIETVVTSENGNFAISNVSLLSVKESTDLTKMSEENCVAEAGVNVGAIIGGIVGGLVIVSIIGLIVWRQRRQSRLHKEAV